MRLYHFLGGLVLACTAAGLGSLAAHPILLQLGKANEAQSALELGLIFFLPFLLPALFVLASIARHAQTRQLHAFIDRHGPMLLQRHALLTAPNRYGRAEPAKWSDEVWEFRRSLPKPLRMLNHAAVLRIVTARVEAMAERMPSAAALPAADQPAFARFVGAELIRLGWRAKLLNGRDAGDVHILAEKNKVRVLVLCCPNGAVTNAEVQRAVKARAHVGADIAAIVAKGEFNAAARALAKHTRVGLLDPSQIRGVHRAAGRVWRARRARLLPRRDASPANARA